MRTWNTRIVSVRVCMLFFFWRLSRFTLKRAATGDSKLLQWRGLTDSLTPKQDTLTAMWYCADAQHKGMQTCPCSAQTCTPCTTHIGKTCQLSPQSHFLSLKQEIWAILGKFDRNSAATHTFLFFACARSWLRGSWSSDWCSECHAAAHHRCETELLHRSVLLGSWSHFWWTCNSRAAMATEPYTARQVYCVKHQTL